MMTSRDEAVMAGPTAARTVKALWTYSFAATMLLMAPVEFLPSLALDMYLPIIPRLDEQFDGTGKLIQLSIAVYWIGLGAGQLVFGPFCDWLGRRPVLTVGTLAFGAASLFMAFAQSGEFFVACRIVQSLGAAAILAALYSTVRDVYGDDENATAVYAFLGATLSIVPALAPLIGALLESVLGWRSIFAALAFAGFSQFVMARLFWAETKGDGHRTARILDYKTMLTDKFFTILSLASSSAYGTFFVYFSISSLFFIQKLGFSTIEFSLIFCTSAVAMIIASRCVVFLVRHIGQIGSLLAGLGLIVLGCFSIYVLEVFFELSATLFLICSWVMCFGIAVASSVAYNEALRSFDDVAGAATSFQTFLESIIIAGFGTLAVLFFPSGSVMPLVCFGIAFPLAAICLIALFLRSSLKRVAPNRPHIRQP